MEEYKDSDGRAIVITFYDDIIASFEGEVIGRGTLIEDDDITIMATLILDEGFHRTGIGQRMVQLAIDWIGEGFRLPNPFVHENAGGSGHFTREGRSFINKLWRNGVISDDIFWPPLDRGNVD